jgi:DNA adenine methylase
MKTPMKRYGGKMRLAPRIAELMPIHENYIEPFAGGASALFEKCPAPGVELMNDLDADLMHLWSIIKNDELCPRLWRRLCRYENTRAGYEHWSAGSASLSAPIDRAQRYFVLTQASFNGVFRGGWSRPTRPSDQNAFANRVARLPQAGERLRNVHLQCGDGTNLIEQYDSPQTLFYIDPPYLRATRVAKKRYRHEMTDFDHTRLLSVLVTVRGMVMLSGYPHPLYCRALAGWTRHVIPVVKHGGSRKLRAEETIWLNPACAMSMAQSLPPLYVAAA